MARIYKRGGHWWGVFEGDRRRSLKIPKTATEAQARRRWLELATEATTAVSVPDEAVVAFSGLAGLWLDLQEQRMAAGKLRPSSFALYRRHFDRHIKDYFGHRDARLITPLDIETFQAHLAQKLSPSTVNVVMAYLSAIFSAGIKGRYLSYNPVSDVSRLKVPTRKWDWFTLDETAVFLDTCKRVLPDWHTWFLLAFKTGMRVGELSALSWGDVDFTANITIINHTWDGEYGMRETKGAEQRRIPMTAAVRSALLVARAETMLVGDAVFLDGEGRRTRFLAREKLDLVCKAAGLRKIRNHDTRHSFASQLVSAGVPILQVARLLGHKNVQLTYSTYAHLAPDALAKSMEAIENLSGKPSKSKGGSA